MHIFSYSLLLHIKYFETKKNVNVPRLLARAARLSGFDMLGVPNSGYQVMYKTSGVSNINLSHATGT